MSKVFLYTVNNFNLQGCNINQKENEKHQQWILFDFLVWFLEYIIVNWANEVLVILSS